MVEFTGGGGEGAPASQGKFRDPIAISFKEAKSRQGGVGKRKGGPIRSQITPPRTYRYFQLKKRGRGDQGKVEKIGN